MKKGYKKIVAFSYSLLLLLSSCAPNGTHEDNAFGYFTEETTLPEELTIYRRSENVSMVANSINEKSKNLILQRVQELKECLNKNEEHNFYTNWDSQRSNCLKFNDGKKLQGEATTTQIKLELEEGSFVGNFTGEEILNVLPVKYVVEYLGLENPKVIIEDFYITKNLNEKRYKILDAENTNELIQNQSFRYIDVHTFEDGSGEVIVYQEEQLLPIESVKVKKLSSAKKELEKELEGDIKWLKSTIVYSGEILENCAMPVWRFYVEDENTKDKIAIYDIPAVDLEGKEEVIKQRLEEVLFAWPDMKINTVSELEESELVWNGISSETTKEELLQRDDFISIGTTEAGQYSIYYMDGYHCVFPERFGETYRGKISSIVITDTSKVVAPRDLKIGESVQSALDKFPQDWSSEYLYESGQFYGAKAYENWTRQEERNASERPSVGRLIGQVEDGLLWINVEAKASYQQLCIYCEELGVGTIEIVYQTVSN